MSPLSHRALLSWLFLVTALLAMPWAAAQQPGLVGSYHGVLQRLAYDAASWPNSDFGSRLELTVAANKTYTGKLISQGTPLSFGGSITETEPGTGTSTASIPARGSYAALQVALNFANDEVTGTLSNADTGDAADLVGWRRVWDAKTRPATNFAGRHHLHLVCDVVSGIGYAVVEVGADGAATLSGKLPDGSSLSFKTFLGPLGQMPFFQTLPYTRPGSFIAAVQLASRAPEASQMPTPIIEGTWLKPAQTPTTRDRFFPEGIQTAVAFRGGLYTAPTYGEVAAGLRDVVNNGRIEASGQSGSSTTPLISLFTLTSAGKLTMATGTDNPAKAKLRLDPATGMFSGTFTLVDEVATGTDNDGNPIIRNFSRNGKFEGLIILNEGSHIAAGHTLIPALPDPFSDPPVTAANAPIYSDKVSLVSNEIAPPPLTFSFSETAIEVTEGVPNRILVTIDSPLTESHKLTFRAAFGSSGPTQAAVAADLTATRISVTAEAGRSGFYVPLPVLDDSLTEPRESFTLVMEDGPGFEPGGNSALMVTITGDDPFAFPPYTFSDLVGLGEPAELSVRAPGDAAYQWQRNGIPLSGASSPTLPFPKARLADAGKYQVKVTTDGVSALYDAELAVVDTLPRVTAQEIGGTAVLTAPLAGNFSHYYWEKDGELLLDDGGLNPRISGARTATLTLRNLTDEDVGTYICTCFIEPNSHGNSCTFHLTFPTSRPVLSQVDLPAGQVFRPYEYALVADPTPTRACNSFSASGLPAGLVIHPQTGIISGTPTVAVSQAQVSFTATNPAGSTSVQARLTVQPYLAGAVGSFQGLVQRLRTDDIHESPPWPWADLGARLEVQTTATGAFTGKLTTLTPTPFSGQLTYDQEGRLTSEVTVPVRGKNQPPLYLRIFIDPSLDRLSGALADTPGWQNFFSPGKWVRVCCWRNIWTKARPATSYLGRYHFRLSPYQGRHSLFGTGFGSFTVPASGSFNVAGVMPDGTPFTAASFLGPRGHVPLYQPLYKTPGSLHGLVQVRFEDLTGTQGVPPGMLPESRNVINAALDAGQESDDFQQLTWTKPFQADPKEKLYREGHVETEVFVRGAIYRQPERGAVVMELPAVADNATLFFQGSDSELQPLSLTLKPGGGATLPTGTDNPMKTRFSVNPATGLFQGTFTRVDEDQDRPPIYDDVTGRLIRAQGYISREGSFQGLIVPMVAAPGQYEALGVFTLPEMPYPGSTPPMTLADSRTQAATVKLLPSEGAAAPLSVVVGDGNEVYLFSEDPAGNQVSGIFVELSAVPTERLTVTLSLEHLTTSAADVSLAATTLVFEPGETYALAAFTLSQDDLDEHDEVFYLKVAEGAGYDVIYHRAVCVILDDDIAVSLQNTPGRALVNSGAEATLSIQAIGSEPMNYQWRHEGLPIPGQNKSSLVIESAQIADGGSYDVVVSNRVGSVTSAAGNITVVEAGQRVITATAGSTAVLPVRLGGPVEDLNFQWRTLPDSEPVPEDTKYSGTQTTSLGIRSMSAADESVFTCQVTLPARTLIIDGVPVGSPAVVVSGGFFLTALVTAAPDLLPLPALAGTVAVPFSQQVPFFDTDITRHPASFTAAGLPAGLGIDAVTGLISGTPEESVTGRSITITATNAAGSDSITTTLTVSSLSDHAIGTWHGSVSRAFISLETAPVVVRFTAPWQDAELGGLLEITTTASGAYSGKLTQGTSGHAFTGRLSQAAADAASESTALIQRTGKSALTLTFTLGNDGLAGTLGDATGIANVNAWRQIWSATRPAEAYAGKYSFLIQGTTSQGWQLPEGAGYATCIVPKNGAAFQITGRLTDGSPLVCSSYLGPRGQFILYQSLYARPGSLLAPLRLATEPTADAGEPVFIEGVGDLFKPEQTSVKETAYREGIAGLEFEFQGGRALPAPVTGQVVMALPDRADNARITFYGAGVEARATAADTVCRILPAGGTRMKIGSHNPAKVTLNVKPATSEFRGTLTLVDPDPLKPTANLTRSVTFQGMIVQLPDGSQLARGYFITKPLSEEYPRLTTSPILSGLVEIVPEP